MIQELRFALYAIRKNIQGSAELRTSFLVNIVAMTLSNFSFIVMWVFFVTAVGVIGGWTTWDIIGLQGFTTLSFGIAVGLFQGLSYLPHYVTMGVFDSFMVSPKNLLLRIAVHKTGVPEFGDMLFGIGCLALYGWAIHASFIQVAWMALLVIPAVLVFLAILIVGSAVSFFFVDGEAVADGFTELFFTPANFHGGAFQGVARFIFTFCVPALLISALPVEAVRDVSLAKFITIWVVAVAWFALSIKLFSFAIKRYESSNFMTFGK